MGLTMTTHPAEMQNTLQEHMRTDTITVYWQRNMSQFLIIARTSAMHCKSVFNEWQCVNLFLDIMYVQSVCVIRAYLPDK